MTMRDLSLDDLVDYIGHLQPELDRPAILRLLSLNREIVAFAARRWLEDRLYAQALLGLHMEIEQFKEIPG